MLKIIKSLAREEWQFLAIISFVVILFIGLPNLVGYLAAPAGFVYDGLGSLSPADNPVYFSYINQVKSGDFFIKDNLTGETQNYGMFNIFWFLAGLFAKVLNLPAPLAFHLLRLVLTPLFVLVAYIFISVYFSEIKRRKLALAFLLFSAGLGAYFILPLVALFDLNSKKGYWTPNDIWIPESIAFLSLYKTPHFILSWIMMMSIILEMFFAFSQKKIAHVFIAGILALIYFNFHPFYIPMIFGTLGLYLLIDFIKSSRIVWLKSFYLILFVLISSPAIIYHSWLLKIEPALAGRAWQNITLAPPFIFIIIGYGFLWWFFIWGLKKLIDENKIDEKFMMLLAWLATSIFLVVLPWQFQGRNTQGLHLPLVIFSIFGLVAFKDWLKRSGVWQKFHYLFESKVFLAMTFVFVFGVSNLFNLTRDLYYFIAKPLEVRDYFYINQNNLLAFKFFSSLNDKSVVIAHPGNAMFIPTYSNNQVYFAHTIETLDFNQKWLYLVWFYRNDNQADKKYEFLKKNHINYVFYSDLEKDIGTYNPATKEYLKEVYTKDNVKIFQVL